MLFTREKMYFAGWTSNVFLSTLLTNSPYVFLPKYGLHEIQPFAIMNMAENQQFQVLNKTVYYSNP